MHSRPPHTNYTDAYPTAAGANFANTGHQPNGSINRNESQSQPHPIVGGSQHHGALSGTHGNAPGYYGPLSPVGRGGSSGSSTSSPSPCGSYPGFPSPAMSEMISNGAMIRAGTQIAPIGSNAMMSRRSTNFDQHAVLDPYDDPFFQQNNNFNNFFGQNNSGVMGNLHYGNGNYSFGNSNTSYDLPNAFLGEGMNENNSSNWNHSAAALRYQQHLQAAAAVTASASNPTNAVQNAFMTPFGNLASRVGAN